MDRHCYDVLSNGLVCRDEKCQCGAWRGVYLEWKEERGVCLSAPGHPCVTEKMCHSDKCVNEICASRGNTINIAHYSSTELSGIVSGLINVWLLYSVWCGLLWGFWLWNRSIQTYLMKRSERNLELRGFIGCELFISLLLFQLGFSPVWYLLFEMTIIG